MDNYNDFLSDLLKAGVTPEKIYQDALATLQEQQKEQEEQKKKKETEEKLAAARDNFISAAHGYFKLAYPGLFDKQSPEEFAEKMETALSQLEEFPQEMFKWYASVKAGDEEKEFGDKSLKDMDIDKVFQKFFKRYGL